jgi:hypothetical protein
MSKKPDQNQTAWELFWRVSLKVQNNTTLSGHSRQQLLPSNIYKPSVDHDLVGSLFWSFLSQ